MRASASVVILVLLAAPASALAQRTLAQDTLSESTPVGVTCGFCAGEAFGVVFRELPAPARGLEASDFPLELRAIQVALASARTTGTAPAYRCEGSTSGGTVTAEITIWAGTTPPSGDIRSFPIDGPWGDEELVWAADAPIDLSLAEAEGASRFTLMLNTIRLANEDGSPIFVSPPRTYLRAQVVLPAGGSSTACEAMSMMPPGGVPVRDDDGRIAPERSFIHAAGAGYLWNESAGVAGDWAIRLQIVPAIPMPTDGGMMPSDGGTMARDAGPDRIDAGSMPADAGGTPRPPGSGGCGCRAGACGGARVPSIVLALLALGLRARVRRRAKAPR